jgi:hypothetical protein
MGIWVCVAVLAVPPWVDDPAFPRANQEKALAATLRLRNPKTAGEGTAVRVGREGRVTYYLTADHCVKDPTVMLDRFTPQSYPDAEATLENVTVVERWPRLDLALLKSFWDEARPVAPICPADKVPAIGKDGLAVLTGGCTDGDPPELQVDRIGGALKIKKPRLPGPALLAWEIERPPVEGRSGGPMFGPDGFLIGICSGTDGKHGYYLHVDEIRKALSHSDLRRLLAGEAGGKAVGPVKK